MKTLTVLSAIAVAAGIILTGMRSARAELVFESDLQAGALPTETVAAAPAQTQVKLEAPAAKADPTDAEVSRAEMMRRQRMREELKNEDLLTTKLEELRLKDEMKRTEQILGSGEKKEETTQPAVMQEVRVGSAAAEAAPASSTVTAVTTAPVAVSAAPVTMTAFSDKESESELLGRVSLSPRGGLSSITNSVYDISSKFSFGFDLSVDATDHIAFLAGYTYSSYNIGPGSTLSYLGQVPFGFRQVQLNDNTINLGMRAYILGPRSKVRPFAGAGVGYRIGHINFDEKTRQYAMTNPYGLVNSQVQDVDVTGFTGSLETGIEFRLTKSIALSGTFRYYTLLSSRQSNPISPYGFMGSPLVGGYSAGLAYPGYGFGDERTTTADAVAKNSFYQLMAGVSVSF